MVALIPSKKDRYGNWLCPVCGSSGLREDELDDGMSLVYCPKCHWNVYGVYPQMEDWDDDEDEEEFWI